MTVRSGLTSCDSKIPNVYADPNSPAGYGTSVCDPTTAGGVLDRSYRLHIPRNYVPGRGALILNLHGHSVSQNAKAREVESGMSAHSDLNGYAVVYPDSTVAPNGTHNWNLFNDPTREDDYLFFRALVSKLVAMIDPDPKRIYISGMSGGGMMTHLVATNLSDIFAAAAPFEGQMPLQSPNVDITRTPLPVVPISMMMVQGDADTSVYMCGRDFVNASGVTVHMTGADENFDHWYAANKCTSGAPAVNFCNGFTPNSAVIDHQRSGVCANGTQVEYYVIRGGVHAYYNYALFNQGTYFNSTFPAPGTAGISENQLVWDFFRTHPKP